jgi:UDP-N-acetylenolpyruvoylglucosamine reductase
MKFSKKLSKNYTNYGNTITSVYYPRNIKDLKALLSFCKKANLKVIPVGSKLSWYDTILNSKNVLLDLKKFKKKYKLLKNNTLIVTPNFTVDEVTKKLQGHGLSLISIPGAFDASIGGCIGNDVHGKDSFRYGNFCENLVYIKILTAESKIITVTKNDANLFRSICGGLGLIGVIIEAKFKLKKIYKFYNKETIKCKNYKILIKNIYENYKNYESIFGWMDLYATKNSLGRGVIFKLKKSKQDKIIYCKLPKIFQNVIDKIRTKLFGLAIKLNLVKYINYLYYNFLIKNNLELVNRKNFIYPLEDLKFDIKKLVYPNNFCEIQIIIEKKNLPEAMINFIQYSQKLDLKGFIAGIKIHKKSDNYLSFAGNGVSLNINHIFNTKNKIQVFQKMKMLHNYCINNGFKIYLAKDFFINKNEILKIYKNSKKFFKTKSKIDSNNLIMSDFYRRLNF